MATAYQVSYERPYRGIDNLIHWEVVSKTISVGSDSTIEQEIEEIKKLQVVDRDRWGERVDHYCARHFSYELISLPESGAGAPQEALDHLYWESLQEVPSPGVRTVSTLRHL